MTAALEVVTTPRPEPALAVSATWLLFGNAIFLGGHWVFAVVLGRIVSPAQVGQYALGLALAAPAFVFADLQLRTMLATDASGQFVFGDYLRLRLVLLAVAFAAVSAVALARGQDAASVSVAVAVGGYKACEGIGDILHGRLQQREHMKTCALSSATKGLLVAALSLGAVLFTNSVFAAVSAMMLAHLVVLALVDVPAVRRLSRDAGALRPERGSWSGALHVLTSGLPLGVVGFLAAVTVNVPLWAAELILGKAELGYLASMLYLANISSAVMVSVGQATMPRLAAYYAGRDARAFFRVVRLVVIVAAAGGGAMVLAIALAGKPLLFHLYGREHAERGDVFLLTGIAVSVGLLATALGQAVTTARAYRALVVPYLAVAVAAAVASFVLVGWLGLGGAPIALAMGYLGAGAAGLFLLLGPLRLTSAPGAKVGSP